MTYVANPTDGTRPLDSDDASGGAAELRALKAYVQGLITGGSSFNGYSWQGFRNNVINGNFDLWQRGASLASGTGARFLADRWFDDSLGTTYTPSRQVHTLGQTAVPLEPTFFSRTVVASVAGAGNYCLKIQRIESVRTFAGQTATFSFYAKADAIKDIAIEFVQSFGTGGSPSATINGIGVTRKTLGTEFQLFSVTVAIPSITGKTIGTNGNDYLACTIWFDAGSNFNARTGSLGQQSGTFDISQVQFEPGGSVTPFELLPRNILLEGCQRYYEQLRIGGTNGAISAAGQILGVLGYYKTTKRAAPTVALIAGTDTQTAFPAGVASFFDVRTDVVGAFKTATAANNNASWFQTIEVIAEL